MPTQISNYFDYKVNEEGPLGKKIKDIIIRSENLIVYLDEEETIQWSTRDLDIDVNSFGSIQNRISFWESVSNKLFSKTDSYDYKCLLAESYARILDSKSSDLANDSLERTVDRMQKHGREILKQVYLLSTFGSTLVVMIILLVVVFGKNYFLEFIAIDSYEIIVTSLFGGIGAFIFSVLRLRNYTPDIVISKSIHKIDGALRVFYGLISGLVIAIGVKSNVILGFINQIELTIYVKTFLGIIAGASEVIIPNLIKQIEDKTSS